MNLFNPQPLPATPEHDGSSKPKQTPDQIFNRLICEHFKTSDSKQVVERMGPTWYAEGIRRVEAGAESVEELFDTKWKLKP